jgi:hypothetical protein
MKELSHTETAAADSVPVDGSAIADSTNPDQASHVETAAADSTPVNGSPVAHPPELDPKKFRLDQNFALDVQAKKIAVSVPVGRPNPKLWICIHPSVDWRAPVALIEDKANQRTYVVTPEIVPEVTGDLVRKLLVTYITTQGAMGLWPIKLPDEGGRLDAWNESARLIVNEYPGQWVRIISNQDNQCYEVQPSKIERPDPQWQRDFGYVFSLAFKNRVISDISHPVLKSLRGESL